MKKMKSLLLVALLLVGAGNVNAQSREKIRFGGEVGMTVNTIKDFEKGQDRKMGFDAGFRMDVNFTDNIYLGTGLQYMMKGVKVSGRGWDEKVTTGYLQIPIHIGYRYDFNETIGIFGEFGPFLAVGVNGKTKYDEDGFSEDADFFGDPDDPNDEGWAKRFDMGLGLHVGCEIIQHWQVALGYDWGLIKMNDGPGDKLRNGSLRLGLTYMF